MIADNGFTPILMDFGSTMKAKIKIENRSQALYQQVKQSNVGLLSMFMCDPRILQPSKAQWRIELLSYLM
jgi:hypothetical protein